MSLPSPSEIASALIAREEMPPEKGDIGPQGMEGKAGEFGPPGPQGAKGDPGRDGTNGSNGDIGPVGPQGPGGSRGLKGEKGDKGDEGERGIQGPQGETGAVGSGRALFPRAGGGSGGGAPSGPAGGDLSGTYPNPSVVDDSHSHGSGTAPGSGGELVGAAVARTIAAGVIDVTGLHYVIVTGEGGLDDDLPTLNGGVDGQFVVLESAGQTITFSYSGNCNLVNQEANSIQLGNFVTQVFAIYSATDGAWQVWSNQQPRSIMAEDGGTEILAGTALIEGFVSAALNWTSVPAGWRAKVGLFLDGINAAPADASLAAGGLALWFDQTNGASALKIKGKSANGTVVTATVPLT